MMLEIINQTTVVASGDSRCDVFFFSSGILISIPPLLHLGTYEQRVTGFSQGTD